MDPIIYVIVASAALAYFTPLSMLLVIVAGGIINVAFNYTLLQAVMEPPWWMVMLGVAQPIQIINTAALISLFIWGATVAGGVSILAKIVRRVRG
jgi:hypothetical protein